MHSFLYSLYQCGDYVCIPRVLLQERAINHAAGSHGVSGIFVKYDINSLMVKVTEQHRPFWQFLVRLCGIVGGIFSTTGTELTHTQTYTQYISSIFFVYQTTVLVRNIDSSHQMLNINSLNYSM